MSSIKIIQYIHRPNMTELGKATTHEYYMRIESGIDLSAIFPVGEEVIVEDMDLKRVYSLKSANGTEFRINQMGPIYRDYNVMPGDEIIITHCEIDDEIKNILTVKTYNRVEFTTNANGSEISSLERLASYKQEDDTYALDVQQNNVSARMCIVFKESKRKRADSPKDTDFYNITINGTLLSSGNYYLTIDDVCTLERRPSKSELNRIVLGNDWLSQLLKKSYVDYKDLQKIYYGTPGSGKSRKVYDNVKGIYPLKEEREKYVFRTTFHPDSDYASFVGCYKPHMEGDKIKYEYTPQAFTDAYVKAWQEIEKESGKQVYLIIEEINRGNCAQIFGDLFQLLDRKDGVSEYPINADTDLRQHLEKELGVGSEGIAGGKLKLPSNLYIWATMNTSDQSLFPMDSAFKRRWTWECVPINYEHPKSSLFIITINGKKYKWHKFLKEVNGKIKGTTESEDKQMGNFFINGDIDERQFIDKVMFYLWNDICKEEYHSLKNFFRYPKEGEENGVEFSFNELFDNIMNADNRLLTGFMEYLEVNPEE